MGPGRRLGDFAQRPQPWTFPSLKSEAFPPRAQEAARWHINNRLRQPIAFAGRPRGKERARSRCAARRIARFAEGGSSIATSTAVCPSGSVAIGGGWQGDVVDGVPAVNEGIGSNEWTVTMDNNAAVSGEFQATVKCAS